MSNPNFYAVRRQLAAIEDHVVALREQLARSRSREHVARSALADLLVAVACLPDTDDALFSARARAQGMLDQLYSSSDYRKVIPLPGTPDAMASGCECIVRPDGSIRIPGECSLHGIEVLPRCLIVNVH